MFSAHFRDLFSHIKSSCVLGYRHALSVLLFFQKWDLHVVVGFQINETFLLMAL